MLLSGLTHAALALATLAPALLPPQVLKFRVTNRMEQEVDATSLGGPKQTVVFKTTSFLTITTNDSAGGRTLQVVVDSIKADSVPPGVPADSVAAVKGLTFTGFVNAAGKVENMKSNGKKVPGFNIESMMREMWPQMRKGVKVGDAWTDTTTSTNQIGGGELTTRAITSYKASGTEKIGKFTATRLDATHNTAIAGSQAAGGGTADIEGTGTGTSKFFIGADGTYLGGESASTSNLTVTLIGAQSGSIPVVMKTSAVATALP